MNNGRARSSPADAAASVGTLAGAGGHEPHDDRAGAPGDGGQERWGGSPAAHDDGAGAPGHGGQMLWRRRLRHDIRHELGTIIMLASAVVVAEDVGDTSRARIDQLLGETRWLDHLLRRLDEDDDSRPQPNPERIRVDELAGEVVGGLRLATPHRLGLTASTAWAHIDSLALWRALRNVLDNACRAATGHVDTRVSQDRGWVVIQVDDDGPGFGAGSRGLGSLGLGIVHDLVSGFGGSLEIRHR